MCIYTTPVLFFRLMRRFRHFSWNQKMMWSPIKLHKDAGMGTSNRKVLVLISMLLLSRLTCDAHLMSECCTRPSGSCRLYVLLCRKTGGGSPTGDAAAGILTLGKRQEDQHRLHSRLNQLLQVSRNQAAGILTMGRRSQDKAAEQYMDWLHGTTPLPM